MDRADELRQALGQRVLLLDGGLGSLLIAGGLEAGRAPEWWNLEHPERIVAAHRSYVEAGSDVIHTNTFGATPARMELTGLAGRCHEVNRRAVALAREARGEAPTFIAGDVGPTGRSLPPVGNASLGELEEAYATQVAALAEAGVDLISVETMYDLREALAAVRAGVGAGLPVWASMTFEPRPRGTFTVMGDRLVTALRALADAGATAVGMNCTVAPEAMVTMVREAAGSVPVPLVAQPNAGQPRATTGGVVYDTTPEEFTQRLLEMVAAGARVVGGCCGTDPGFIRAARAALDAG